MNRKILILLVALTVTVSGCTDVLNNDEEPGAELIGDISESQVTDESPGQIVLNARNYGNQSYFYAEVRPMGDYSEIVRITDTEGNEAVRQDLGEAVQGATTGEQFMNVEKRLNVTSTARVQAELYSEDSEEPLDTQTYLLNVNEE